MSETVNAVSAAGMKCEGTRRRVSPKWRRLSSRPIRELHGPLGGSAVFTPAGAGLLPAMRQSKEREDEGEGNRQGDDGWHVFRHHTDLPLWPRWKEAAVQAAAAHA